MMWVGHVLEYVPDHVLDHMIIGFVTTMLHFDKTNFINTLIRKLPLLTLHKKRKILLSKNKRY